MSKNLKYKYLFFAFALIGIIFFLAIIYFATKPTENNETNNGYIYDYIEISNIEDYQSCLIFNHEPYFLFEEITVDHSILENRLTVTNSEFSKTSDNMYKDIDGAVYNYEEGYNIYLLKENDSLVVDNNYGIGDALFVKDYDKYKNDYNIKNRMSGEVLIFTDAKDGIFENPLKMDIEYFKTLEETDFDEDINNYTDILLSVVDNGLYYNYYAKYIEEENHIIVYDYLNEIAICGELLIVEE